MPVENRLDMELTGIKTPVGIKVQGPDINEIQRIGSEIEEVLGPGGRNAGGFCGAGVARVFTSISSSIAMRPRAMG